MINRLSASISVIVLAYNDAPSLPVLVPRLRNTLAGRTEKFEVIIVDDHSTDSTARVAEDLAAEFKEVRLIRHERNKGVGAAFRSGLEASSGEWVGYVDGDSQYDPEDFVLLIQEMVHGADMVSGRRVRRADSHVRRIISRVFNGFMHQIYGTSLRDTNSGIKLYRKDLLNQIGSLVSDGAFFDAEILIKATHARARMAELPVTHQPRRHGRALGASPANLCDVLRGLSAKSWACFTRPGLKARAARVLVFFFSLICRLIFNTLLANFRKRGSSSDASERSERG